LGEVVVIIGDVWGLGDGLFEAGDGLVVFEVVEVVESFVYGGRLAEEGEREKEEDEPRRGARN
jgi:hypothetical protein